MQNKTWMLCLTIFLLALTACNNNGKGATNTDTTVSRLAGDNTRVRDTASYERMPQKATDSLP